MPEHTELITASRHAYQISMGGTMDGANTRDPVGYSSYGQAWEPNLSVHLENVGREVIKNPWIAVDGKRRWRSLEEILEEILEEGMSEAEKARAIWEFARQHRYHFTTADDEVKDTVKMLNLYGYTLCWDEAYTLANLWQAAGLRIRRGIPHGHCTTEVYFAGGYHLLDSDEHLLMLRRDNETIAGEEELAHDHDLVKRSHVYGILNPESRETSERAASLFIHAGPRGGGRPFIGGHRMELELRPGEALIWEWQDRGKYHGYNRRPPLLANGWLRYAPVIGPGFERWAAQAVNLQSTAEGLQPLRPGEESTLCYCLQSPYVIVGGQVEVSLANSSGICNVEVSLDGQRWDHVALVAGAAQQALSLDKRFSPEALACYRFYVRLRGTRLVLKGMWLAAELQMAPLSLPALEVGENQVLYTDESPGERRVRITHVWQERSDFQPPPAPSRPVFPESGSQVEGTQFTFSWESVSQAADYHFQLSPRPDLKYCLSPTFDKLISRTPGAGTPTWRIPGEGLLNPGQTYYWRVRSRIAEGLWGPWGPTWSFVPQAPGVPLELRLEIDWGQRIMVLHWQANPQGRSPVRYEVYGSDERGFTASPEPYPVHTGQGQASFPANLLAPTTATSLIVVGADLPPGRGNRCFFRVVAVDEEGCRSGPSEYAGAVRPFVYSRPPAEVVAGQVCTYQLEVLRSAGELRSLSNGPQRYLAAFRDADELRYLLDEGPNWVELNEKTGRLTASPRRQDAGTHTITVRVQNNQGGMDVQGFDLRVVAP